MKKRELSPFTRWLGEKFIPHPSVQLAASESLWNETHNPVHVWNAIEICTEQKQAFPAWVIAYLGETAKRMSSPQALEKEFRDALPAILGFPVKRGPPHPLRPFPEDDRMIFAMAFATKIGEGAKPIDALHNAAAEVLDLKKGDKIDDKTLRGWIKEYFELEVTPRNNAEYRAAIRSWLDRVWGPIEELFRESSP
jgi:hypothetical protein